MEKNWTDLSNKEIDKMQKIAKSAAKLFNEKGYLETSMDDISNAAQLSKGGIYHYFSSKNEILFFISANFMDLLLRGLEEELQKIEDCFSKLKYFISRHIKFYSQYLSEAKTVIHEAHLLPPDYFKVIADKERQYHQIVSDILFDYFEGKIEKDRLKAVAFILFGTCNGIYYWYNPKGSITPDNLSEIIGDILCVGLTGYKQQKGDTGGF
ncbi:MAG: TetR/AcrR family transcriptional regulator [Deltaproteobacteria bacterium]|nr:TetR/AcrR family transcriptional regulator [Deltaproteobacteria bacterium]